MHAILAPIMGRFSLHFRNGPELPEEGDLMLISPKQLIMSRVQNRATGVLYMRTTNSAFSVALLFGNLYAAFGPDSAGDTVLEFLLTYSGAGQWNWDGHAHLPENQNVTPAGLHLLSQG